MIELPQKLAVVKRCNEIEELTTDRWCLVEHIGACLVVLLHFLEGITGFMLHSSCCLGGLCAVMCVHSLIPKFL